MAFQKLKQSAGWSLTVRFYHRFVDNAATGRAAQIAYYFLFALFPFLFFLVTLTAYLPMRGTTDQMMARLSEVMPPQALSIIQDHLRDLLERPRPHLLSFGLAAAIWSASRGVEALRGSLNLAYDVKESRPFWRTQGMAIVLTVVTSLLILASVVGVALGGVAGIWAARHLHLESTWIFIYGLLRWPLTGVLVMLVLGLLYYFLPDVEQEWRFIRPGSVIGTMVWLVATWGFTLYAEHFGKYNVTYGSIGGVIVLMTWLYISGVIFIVGGEINALLEHDSRVGKVKGARAPGEAPAPAADRPSAAAPGAVEDADAADRSHRKAVEAGRVPPSRSDGRPPRPTASGAGVGTGDTQGGQTH